MKYLAIILLALLSSACSSKPDPGLVTALVQQTIHSRVGKLFAVENLTMDGGFRSGENRYKALVKYQLVFKLSLEEANREMLAEARQLHNEGALQGAHTELIARYGGFAAGDRISKSESLIFEKTVSGWILAGDNPSLY